MLVGLRVHWHLIYICYWSVFPTVIMGVAFTPETRRYQPKPYVHAKKCREREIQYCTLASLRKKGNHLCAKKAEGAFHNMTFLIFRLFFFMFFNEVCFPALAPLSTLSQRRRAGSEFLFKKKAVQAPDEINKNKKLGQSRQNGPAQVGGYTIVVYI